jgi:hypothetical protein
MEQSWLILSFKMNSNVLVSNKMLTFHRREFGLERFVPVSLMSTMKRKELRKLIGHFLKLNHNLSPTGQKSLTSLQAKLYYLNIISELPSYGAKCFSTNIRVCQIFKNDTVKSSFKVSWIEVYPYFVAIFCCPCFIISVLKFHLFKIFLIKCTK